MEPTEDVFNQEETPNVDTEQTEEKTEGKNDRSFTQILQTSVSRKKKNFRLHVDQEFSMNIVMIKIIKIE